MVKVPKITKVVVIVDETGSMGNVRQQTISSINEYFGSLRADQSGAVFKVTLATFNSLSYRVRFSDLPISEVKNMTYEEYNPNGWTNLYDAVGKTLNDIDDTNANVVVVIISDGEENASREFTQASIKALVEQKTAAGWQFTYLGADLSASQAASYAGSLGLSACSAMAYSKGDTMNLMRRMSDVTVAYASGALLDTTVGLESLRGDFESKQT